MLLWLHPQSLATPVQAGAGKEGAVRPCGSRICARQASVTPLHGGHGAGRVCNVNTAPPRNRAGKSICQDAAHQLAFAGIITHLRTAGFRELIRGSLGSWDSQGRMGDAGTQHSLALPTVPGAVPEAASTLPVPRGNLARQRGPRRTPQYNSKSPGATCPHLHHTGAGSWLHRGARRVVGRGAERSESKAK